MTTLIEQVFLSRYGSQDFTGDDSATLSLGSHRLAFTTDSFVVDPLFFPGGDIGRLAVAGRAKGWWRDELWSLSDSDLIEKAWRDLAHLGFYNQEAFIDGFVVRYAKAYPMYEEG